MRVCRIRTCRLSLMRNLPTRFSPSRATVSSGFQQPTGWPRTERLAISSTAEPFPLLDSAHPLPARLEPPPPGTVVDRVALREHFQAAGAFFEVLFGFFGEGAAAEGAGAVDGYDAPGVVPSRGNFLFEESR